MNPSPTRREEQSANAYPRAISITATSAESMEQETPAKSPGHTYVIQYRQLITTISALTQQSVDAKA